MTVKQVSYNITLQAVITDPVRRCWDLYTHQTNHAHLLISAAATNRQMEPVSTPLREVANAQPRKLRAACDQCHASKLKCPGGNPPCKRCEGSGQSCHYSLAARMGKPPGSKNRKTLERLRRANSNLDGHDSIDGNPSGNNTNPINRRNSRTSRPHAEEQGSDTQDSNDDYSIDNDDHDRPGGLNFPVDSNNRSLHPRPPASDRSRSAPDVEPHIPSLATNVDIDMQLNLPGTFAGDFVLPSADFTGSDRLFDPAEVAPFGSMWMDMQQECPWNVSYHLCNTV